MDTGVGRTSYSIMAQGQIDQVLSSKPEERRAVFEEAAGITRYKSQRREALGKLALTDQNLARITDVIAEVGRQIGSLRRQAAKAMRYKRLSFRLRHLSLAHSGWQWGQLSATIAGLEADVAAPAARRPGRCGAALEARQRELNDAQGAAQRPQPARAGGPAGVFDLRSQKEQAENQAGLAADQADRPRGTHRRRAATTSPSWKCSCARWRRRWTAGRRTSSSSSTCSAAPTPCSSSATASWPSSRAS